MHFLAEYFPLILFFVAFKVADIYVATAVAIVASIAQIVYFRVRRGKVAPMHWMSLGIIVVFGGATLLLHDETFIKWKPTVLYWLFAAVLLAGRVVFRRNLIAALLPDLVLPEPLWGRITWAWVAFLTAMGAANLYIAARFTTDVWVNFKIWGGMGLFMLAAVGTVASVARYLPEKS
ncbi:MAG: septation protein A [Betaproteobacteria bacterium]